MATRSIKDLTALKVLALALLLLVTGGCGLRGPAYSDMVVPEVDHVVDMGLRSFVPPAITIAQGDLVEWRNTSPISHTVTAVPGQARNPANVLLPEGAQPFDSGDIPAGQIYRHRFAVPGTYRYFCRPHEMAGMVGSVIVASPIQGPAP